MTIPKPFTLLVLAAPLFTHSWAQTFSQQGPKLVVSGAVGLVGPQLGYSVALSRDGNTGVVGGPAEACCGAAWVFTRANGAWTQQADKLVGADRVGPYATQGASVALSADGSTALVGGPGDNCCIGAAWVFTRDNVAWSQQGPKLVGTGTVGLNASQGFSVALSADGNTALVGGDFYPYSGAAWVFTRTGGIWTQQGSKLVGTGTVGPFADQGYSVALSSDGNTALVGGTTDNGGAGTAWVYTRANGAWTQQGDKLVGSGAVGKSRQGTSVALSGDGNTALVGGPFDDGTGATWVFTRTGSVWTQQGSKLVGTGSVGPFVAQGRSVALSADGNTALIGGPEDNNNAGAVWVFTRANGLWTQLGNKMVGAGAVGSRGSQQGSSVALSGDGNTAFVGGPYDGDSYAGAVWVFTRPPAITKYQFVSLAQSDTFSVPAATGISDNGTVIGYLNDRTDAAVLTRSSGIPFRTAGLINGINVGGDIVGQVGGHPFVSKAPYESLIDLAPVFGWVSGNAVAINDRGEILATGGSPAYSFDQWFPGLDITDVVTINNPGQVIGRRRTIGADYDYFLYTPGQSVAALSATPIRLNNKGHILYEDFVQTPTGRIPLPAGFYWVGLNDADEVVGFSSDSTPGDPNMIPAYYSVASGLINLRNQILNPDGLRNFTPAAINNRGEIAVSYSGSTSRGIGVLVPATLTNMNRRSQVSNQEALTRSQSDYTLNGAPGTFRSGRDRAPRPQ